MEQAAKKSGILKDGDWDAGRFMFALEPEAASVYCLYVADKELGIVEDKSTMMIVDCGGGTVDLTVHEIIREGRDKGLREVVPGSGAADGHGGKDVDKNFLNYFAKVLGGGAIDKFEKDYPESYVQMMDDWETLKYGFDPVGYERGIFSIPGELRDLLQKQYPKVLEELANKQNGNNYKLWLTREVMEEDIFGSVVNNILAQVESTFQRIGGKCDYLYLVGGFATSRFLQQRIKEKFANHVKKRILIPGEPGKSIMMGAASFARNPDIILPRKSRLTYGVASSMSELPVILLMGEFLPHELPSQIRSDLEKFKKSNDGKSAMSKLLSRARNKAKEMGESAFLESLKGKIYFDERNNELDLGGLFTTFITFGETVVKNHAVPHLFYVTDKYMQEATIRIFATSKTDVFFADEDGVNQIGEIDLKLPPIEGERRIEITMYFGDTKVKVKAKSLESDHEVEAELDFLTGHAR